MSHEHTGYLSPRLDGGAIVLACPNGRGGELAQVFTFEEARQFVAIISQGAREMRRQRGTVRVTISAAGQSAEHELSPYHAIELSCLVAQLIARAEHGARDLTATPILAQRT